MWKELSVSSKNMHLSALPPLNIKAAHRQFYLQNDKETQDISKEQKSLIQRIFFIFAQKIKAWHASTHT